MSDGDSRTVASVETACELVEHLRRRGGATVTELADVVDRAPGTVHTHLATLKAYGFVRQEETRYRLGPQFLTLGEYVRHQSRLYKAAHEHVDDLADSTGEAAHLIIEHDARIYALYEQFGPNAVGKRLHDKKRERPLHHLHCTAAGKAILAFMDERRLSEVLETMERQPVTQNTLTSVDDLLADLEKVREEGVAYADEEQVQGIRAVGAPVRDTDEDVLGAIAVSGPTTRLQDDFFCEVLPYQVRHAASVTELDLQTAEA